MLKPVRSLLVILSSLAVILAACGGSPTGGSADPSTPGDPAGGGSTASGAIHSPSPAPGSSQGEGSGGAADLTACDLLTDADIEELMGRTVARREPGVALGIYQDGCEWFFEEEADAGLAQLVVGTFPTGGRQLWERSYAGVAEDMGMEVVAGIGEAAFRQGAGSFSALQADRIVDVFYLPVGVADRAAVDETAKALLTRAVARASGAAVEPGGASPTPDGGAGATDICALLSSVQIEEFAMVPLKEARPLPTGCRWVLDSDSMVPDMHGLTAEVTPSGGRARFDALSALTPVPGIGDGAVKSGGNTDGTVWAVRGDTLVKVQYALPLDVTDADPVVLPLLELLINGL